MKFFCFLTLIIVVFGRFEFTEGFAECPNSNLGNPSITGVTDCTSWVAYLLANNPSGSTTVISNFCANSSIAIKCCFQCSIYQNYNVCTNLGSQTSCNSIAQSGTCNVILADGNPKSYYCALACGTCSSTQGVQCSSLSSSVCGNGVCSQVIDFGVSTAACSCNSGYYGASCSQANVCVGSSNPCKNGATCQTVNDADIVYTCTCTSGCTGKNCDQCGCAAGGSFSCSNGGVCLNSGLCQCAVGYSGSTCQTYIGCNAGGSLSCSNGGICLASGSCTCTTGWSGNTCLTPQGCNNAATACLNSGTCNTGTGACSCTSGWTGTQCQTGLGCNAGGSSACLNGGVCLASTGNCNCLSGYSGTVCQTGNACTVNPCKNGAVCSVVGNNATCACTTGYYGYYCDSLSPCAAPSPCLNGGTCTTVVASASSYYYTCSCPTNYYGTTCQVRVSNTLCTAADTSASLCAQWKTAGFCSYTYYYQAIPVPVYCPQSCSLCGTVAICADTQTNCAYWAAANLCPTLQNLGLIKLCRKSCNACPPSSRKRRFALPKVREIVDKIIHLDNFIA